MKKKLLVQVAVVISVLLVLVLVIFMFVVFANTASTYFAAKNETVDRDVGVIYHNFDTIKFKGAAFDYLLDRVGNINIDEIYSEIMEVQNTKYQNIKELAFKDNDEVFNALTDTEKEFNSVMCYTVLLSVLNSRMNVYDYEDVYVLAVDDNGNSNVVMEGSRTTGDVSEDEVMKFFGSEPEIDMTHSREIEKICREKISETRFEILYFYSPEDEDNSSQLNSYYAGYKLLTSTGKRDYILCAFHNNSALFRTLNGLMLPMLVVSAVLIGITDIILIIFLRRKVIRPISLIQKNVREYTNTKDTAHIVNEMSGIMNGNEFGTLARDIEYMAEEMERYNEEISKFAAEREHTATELETAAKIQTSQLPRKFPEYKEFEIYASMTPAKEVGGDFYDFFMLDKETLGLVIADVSGKGVPAALFMMYAKNLINNYSIFGGSPAKIIKAVNNRICRDDTNDMFVTVWLGILNINTGKMTCCNAGHEYPAIKRAGGKFELLDDNKHGLFVGMIPGVSYTDYEIQFENGDTLFVYTDGIPEATNTEFVLYGEERMIDALNAAGDVSLEELLKSVRTSVDWFVGNAPQFDDLTMLAIKYFGK